MAADAPKPKRSRRWLKSLIVLLIGLAYLAGVYIASPRLRWELRYARERETLSRMRQYVLAPVDRRVLERARRIQRLRATASVVRYEEVWRPATPGTAEPFGEAARERTELRATLLLDAPNRLRVEVEGDSFWGAWILDGDRGWYMAVDSSEPDAEMGLLSGRRLWMWSSHSWSYRKAVIPVFHPYVKPDGFADLLRSPEVRKAGQGMFDGHRCRVVRVSFYHYIIHAFVEEKVPYERWDLWIREDTNILVKAEHTYLDAEGRPKHEGEPDIVCVLTGFEEGVEFEDEDFDPLPLVRKFSALAQEMAAEPPEAPKPRLPPF